MSEVVNLFDRTNHIGPSPYRYQVHGVAQSDGTNWMTWDSSGPWNDSLWSLTAGPQGSNPVWTDTNLLGIWVNAAASLDGVRVAWTQSITGTPTVEWELWGATVSSGDVTLAPALYAHGSLVGGTTNALQLLNLTVDNAFVPANTTFKLFCNHINYVGDYDKVTSLEMSVSL